MSVKFHCSHCNKLIKAPDEAGGKHGKCPYCKQEVYVPTPDDQLDVIPLAPIDQDAEQRERELAEEDLRLRAAASREEESKPRRGRPTHVSDDTGPIGLAGESLRSPPPATTGGGATAMIVRFVLAMQASELDEADRLAARLKRAGGRAKDEVQRLMVDEIPAAGLEDVPPALCKGFLKSLLERL